MMRPRWIQPLVFLLLSCPTLASAPIDSACLSQKIHYLVSGPPTITVLSGSDIPGSTSLKVAKMVKRNLEKQGVVVNLVDLSQVPKEALGPNYLGTPSA